MADRDFIERLNMAFGHESMADVARRLKMPHATVRNYYMGRLPAPEVLIKIANETGISLNWLLTGRGNQYVGDLVPIDLGKFFEQKVGEIIDRKLSENRGLQADKQTFDVRAAVARLGNPQRIMSDWFAFEGREYPQDFGVVFFRGWESFSLDEQVEAVIDAKRALDRSLRRG